MPRTRQTLAAHLAPFRKGPQASACNGAPGPGPEVAEGLLRRGEITLLVGRPKDGKTCLAATLATAVARGEPFASIPTARTNVLYLAGDESPLEWWLGIGDYLSRVCPRRLAVVCASIPIDRKDALDVIERKIRRDDIGLLVVDPLLAALDANDLVGFPGARSALLGLRTLCRRTNAAAIVTHLAHERAERAVRAAGHPILETVADRTFVLNHETRGDARLVTLRSPERTLRLLSRNPAHYGQKSTTVRKETPQAA